MAPIIDTSECAGCGICVDGCEQEVLDIVDNAADVINEDDCVECGTCVEECPMGAISLEEN